MFFTTALIAALAPALALAAPSPAVENVHVLPDLGDGVYTASVDASGNVNVTRIGDLSPSASRRSTNTAAPLDQRTVPIPISNWGCMAVHSSIAEFQAAENDFKHRCDAGATVHDNNVFYTIAGNSIAYVCSWGGDQPCASDEYQNYLDHITLNCGQFRGGWVDMANWKKQYGMHLKGEKFCGYLIR